MAIAAGGTAGHVVPALSVADALRAEGAEVVFVGGGRAEASLVPAAGYRLRRIRAEGLSRSNPLRAARALAVSARGVGEARRVLADERIDVVLGAGGYVAGSAGLAAVSRRIPLVLAEADSHLGLSNRALARFAARVCLAFPIAGRSGPRFVVTGRPVPPPATDRAAARERFGIAPEARCVLVFGGSLGARTVNEAAVAGLAGLPADVEVIHAAGERDLPGLVAPGPRYHLHGFVRRFGEALCASDLVVARAGGSVFEIAASGRPAILVPYPHASADHQAENARWMERTGAAVVIADADLSAERLGREVGALLADGERLAAMARASAALARPNAARDVAAEVLAAAGRQGKGGPDRFSR